MRTPTTIISLALAAGLAVASPLIGVKAKKDIVVDVITDVVWITVTEIEGITVTVPFPGSGAQYPSAGLIPKIPTTPAAPATTIVVTTSEVPVPVPVPTSICADFSSFIEVEVTVPAVLPPTTAAIVEPEPSPSPPTTAAVVEPSPSSSTTAAAASLPSPTDFISSSLYHHNVHRANHSVDALEWDDDLASYAAIVAASCVYGHNTTPGGGGYGQNIACYGSTGDPEALGAAHEVATSSTDMWYNGEVNAFLPSYYGQSTPDMSNFEVWGHFSQMVWKSTERVGCASQFCESGLLALPGWFTVCNYGPPGNDGGDYGKNVLPPLGDPTINVK